MAIPIGSHKAIFEVSKPTNTPETMPIASLIPFLLLINLIIVRFLITNYGAKIYKIGKPIVLNYNLKRIDGNLLRISF